MNIRSKALRNYLSATGVLNGTPEQIAYAKQAYRKQYKRNWKAQKRPRKELRVEVTLKQYAAIVQYANAHGMRSTPFARNAIMQAVTGSPIPYGYDRLLQILQLVSMATIATSHNPGAERAHQLLLQAENLLLTHIKQTTP